MTAAARAGHYAIGAFNLNNLEWTKSVLKAAQETGAIVTTEEANVLGGLGAAVCEYLAEACPVPVVRHGVNDEFGRSGKAPLVLEAYGITAEKIAECAKKAISLKK